MPEPGAADALIARPARSTRDGLVACVCQHAATGEVLMVAWANADGRAPHRRDAAGRRSGAGRGTSCGRRARPAATRSPSRRCGSTATATRCSSRSTPVGPACHTGSRSCFGDDGGGVLGRLRATIVARADADPASSYTARLLQRPARLRGAQGRRGGRRGADGGAGLRRAGGRGRRPLVPQHGAPGARRPSIRWRRSTCLRARHAGPGESAADPGYRSQMPISDEPPRPARRPALGGHAPRTRRARAAAADHDLHARATSCGAWAPVIGPELARELLNALAFSERLDKEEFALVGELALIARGLLPRLVGRGRHRRRRVARRCSGRTPSATSTARWCSTSAAGTASSSRCARPPRASARLIRRLTQAQAEWARKGGKIDSGELERASALIDEALEIRSPTPQLDGDGPDRAAPARVRPRGGGGAVLGRVRPPAASRAGPFAARRRGARGRHRAVAARSRRWTATSWSG